MSEPSQPGSLLPARLAQGDLLDALVGRGPAVAYIKQADNDRRYIYCNLRWQQVFGRSPDEWLGKTDVELFPETIAREFRRNDDAVLSRDQDFAFLETTQDEKGRRYWYSHKFPLRTASGQIFLAGFSLDITAPLSRRRRASLVECKGTYRSFGAAFGIIRGEGDTVRDANPSALKILGYRRTDLVGGHLHLGGLLPPEPGPAGEKWLRDLATGGGCVPRETELVRKDGTRVPVFLGCSGLTAGRDGGWICYLLDRTEAKQEETRRQRIRAWESIGMLSAGLAHDFNNLLVVIIGHASMAAADPSTPAGARAHMGEVLSASEQAAELVQQLLAYSGKTRLSRVPLSIGTLLKEVRAEFEVPGGLKVDLRVAPGLPTVLGDVPQIRQMLRALAVNAQEAVGGQGTIRVEAEVQDTPRPLRVVPEEELPPGRYVVITVADEGLGMSPEVLNRVFEPFFTTKFPGRGMGLPAAFGIVRRHGGGIRVESWPERGSRFHIYLPAKP